ncbi:MAG: coproporphyrinogen III oxidase family protein [Deltaproteobacteria bacterium]|nr:coproporphyrinogen III oxidase family protein [Deltaproteobacteria bacterium]
MIRSIITHRAKREFARVTRFTEGANPRIGSGNDGSARLLYLHIPFCERLCPYCSFNRILLDVPLCRRYFQALRREIGFYKDRGFDFQSAYVGGGTPTVLIDEMEETLALARQCFSIAEISLETNPNHLTAANIAALKRAGVNRLSVGIQTFDDDLLRQMERYEQYGSAAAIAGRLREILGEFQTLNADMIFNFPSQTRTMLEKDLDVLTGLAIDQITYYPLMVSDSTRKRIREVLGTVRYGREANLYQRIVKRLEPSYRFSSAWCFSKEAAPIDEYIVQYDEYAGLGSGSIGYLQGTCYANTFDIPEYIARIEGGKMPLMASRDFTIADRIRYDFLMKLFGLHLNLDTLQIKYGKRLNRHLLPYLLIFFLAGSLRIDGSDVSLTKRGRYHWVIMMREFFIAVNNFRDYCRGRVSS